MEKDVREDRPSCTHSRELNVSRSEKPLLSLFLRTVTKDAVTNLISGSYSGRFDTYGDTYFFTYLD